MVVFPVLLWAACVLLLVLYLQYRWTNRHILSAAAKLPCPPGWPLIGNALFFVGNLGNLSKNIATLARQFKGPYCLRIGPVPIFVVSEPLDAQLVLNSSNALEKDETYRFLKPWLGNGLITAPVHTWKKYRRLINPVLHPSNVKKFLPVFNDVGRQLAEELISGKQPVDPKNAIFSASLDSIIRSVFARESMRRDIKTKVQILLHWAGTMYTYRLFKPWLYPDWAYHMVFWRQVNKARKDLGACLNVFEEERQTEITLRSGAKTEKRIHNTEKLDAKNMVDIAYESTVGGEWDDQWRHEVTTMVSAGADTVVSAINFTLVTVANYPEVQRKIQSEIREVMGDCTRDLTLEDINSMTYLDQVIMETMRLHGVVPFILRQATNDTKLSGCTLPAGSRIMIPLHAMGINPKYFPQPNKFLPDRFSLNTENAILADGPKKAFIPFSGGPRNCIGKTYALLFMKTVLAHLFRRCWLTTDVRLQDIEYDLIVVMSTTTSLLLNVQPHQQTCEDI